MLESYKETRLWHELGARAADPADRRASHTRALLELRMDEIQTILAKAIPLKDFTLHDQDHSFRVAQRITDIVPADVVKQLSSYELALLLLSAYLHDIGMLPESGRVEQHARYLRGEPDSGLSPTEIDALETWLLESDYDEDKGNLDEKLSYYCRHMHNEWGPQWTSDYFAEKDELYNGWIEDIKKLCKSHHQGYEELVDRSFDPIIKDGNNIHFRYLAAVLRVADVMEFDPERTPRVLFRHRQIDKKSRIFWLKDHEVDLAIASDKSRVILSARPSSAVNHRAIEVMMNDIEAELQLCRNLDLEKPFDRSRMDKSLPHKWVLPNTVQREFRPQEKDGHPIYEYIDGAFRPDTAKLLELLAGTELYGTWLAGVRELLSNSFDAVRERIARQRLKLPDPLDERRVAFLEGDHFVRLRLEAKDGRVFLVCEDSGVGMDKAIIRDYLLVSGKSRRPDLIMLEHKCRERRFSFDHTGKFGIGVLSYFMFADKVTIRTRRNEGELRETHGWQFETDGIGSFGELRRDDDISGGTEVTLRLRREVYGEQFEKMVERHQPDDLAGRQWTRENWGKMEPQMLAMQISEYLKANIVRAPCCFEFRCIDLKDSEILEIVGGPGSIRSEQEWRARVSGQLGEIPYPLLADPPIRFEWCEGKLPEDVGDYRLGLPYFELPGGASLRYFDASGSAGDIALAIGDSFGLALNWAGEVHLAWKGMAVQPDDRGRLGSLQQQADRLALLCEVDWRSDRVGKISVNRGVLDFSSGTVFAWLEARIGEFVADWLRQNASSDYHLLNCHAAGLAIDSPKRPSWIFRDGDAARLRPVADPAALAGYRPSTAGAFFWKGRRVTMLEDPASYSSRGNELFGLKLEILPPDRVVALLRQTFSVVPLWTALDGLHAQAKWPRPVCRFPPAWNRLCGVALGRRSVPLRGGAVIPSAPEYVFNADSPVVYAAEAIAAEDSRQLMVWEPEPMSKGKAASDLLGEIISGRWREPGGQGERALVAPFARLRSQMPAVSPLYFWDQSNGSDNSRLLILDQNSISYAEAARITEFLPDPDPEWILEVAEGA